MIKIIFLDIDGVLNHEIWFQELINNKKTIDSIKNYEDSAVDPKSIELLNKIITDTGAKVVISSSWRKTHTAKEIQTILNRKGFKGEVIGLTPTLYFTGLKDYNYSVPRGNEIKAWLETNKDVIGGKISRVKYVIFDDDNDMLLCQKENFFKVDPYCGLTKNIINMATQFLFK